MSPWERRPVEGPSEAKRLAIQSYHEQRAREARQKREKRSAPRPALSASASRYAAAEGRWQRSPARKRLLRKAASANLQAVADRAQLLAEKARRAGKATSSAGALRRAKVQKAALARRTDAAIAGEAGDTPRYSAAELEELARQGKAFRLKSGRIAFPIVDGRDLRVALAQWTPAVPEAIAVKAFIRKRAILLRLDGELPKSWLPAPPEPLAENERQRARLR